MTVLTPQHAFHYNDCKMFLGSIEFGVGMERTIFHLCLAYACWLSGFGYDQHDY